MRAHPIRMLMVILASAAILLSAAGCSKLRSLSDLRRGKTDVRESAAAARPTPRPRVDLIEVASSGRQWTGVAVSRSGRIFLNYPRWSDNVPFSVGELKASGDVTPFPDSEINTWDDGASPLDHFICVQSVFVDGEDYLWVLDAANPGFRGVVPGGPKLVKVDPAKGRVVATIGFDEKAAPPESYLNDVRVDTGNQVAYVSDSGLGAILVVDLKAGTSRRVLSGHPSTTSEDITLTIGGKAWLRDGRPPRVNADGLALTSDGKYLYYQALTGRTLYRVETRWLRDRTLSAGQLGAKVESMYETGAADGLAFGDDGYLYVTAIEEDAIKRFVSLGTLETVAADPNLKWPDSMARGPDGFLYVTTSQINRGPDPGEPYMLFRFRP